VLPTSGTARFSSPLGVYDFQKRSSLIEVSQAGAQVLGVIAAELAYGEGCRPMRGLRRCGSKPLTSRPSLFNGSGPTGWSWASSTC
jgi:hypothetical protein